ncbi:hypothetical protein CIT292_07597 [Citrobacter youngae ATCC 29220]|uniref:Uncharacterized protein n=1 Tax=Citrobacter youngae ATCC 29220 TaxID=500640 RepID=D4BAV1_9ENTR|nr:hypothetical protein CIT292_07597 [Citrobacter youngae ATCC 29220]
MENKHGLFDRTGQLSLKAESPMKMPIFCLYQLWTFTYDYKYQYIANNRTLCLC